MPGDEAVRIDVTIEEAQAEKNLDGLKRKSSQTFKSFEKDTRKGGRAAKKFGGAVSSLKRTVMGLAAGLGAVALGRKAVSNFLAQEKAVVSLDAALIAQGNTLPWVRTELEEYASALQQVTIHGDEATLQGMALATSLGATKEQAIGMAAAAADLSVAVNQDYTTSIRMLAETLGGQARSIGMKLPAARGMSVEDLKAGKIVELVEEMFGGMAERLAESGGGRLQQVLNDLGDDLEPAGGVLVEALAFLGRGVAATADIIEKVGKEMFGETDADRMVREAEERRTVPASEWKWRQEKVAEEKKYQEDLVAAAAAQRKLFGDVQTKLGAAGLALLDPDASDRLVKFISHMLAAAGSGNIGGLLMSPEQQHRAQLARINAQYDLAAQSTGYSVYGVNVQSGLEGRREAALGAARREYEGEPKTWEELHPATADFADSLANDVEMSLGSAIRRAMTGDAKGAIDGFALMLGNSVLDSISQALARAFVEGIGGGGEGGFGGLMGILGLAAGGDGTGGDAPVDAGTTAGAGAAA